MLLYLTSLSDVMLVTVCSRYTVGDKFRKTLANLGRMGRRIMVNEQLVVEHLRDQLSSQHRKIIVHENLANLVSFKAALECSFGYPPVLNEVDMMLVGREGQFYAIEVKYFDIRNGSFTRPFYDGIGQALSLLRYGFDNVALWHVFADGIDQARLDRYGAATWWFLHNQTSLPLEFTYFKVADEQPTLKFVVMQYKGPSSGAALLPINDKHFNITWTHPNPFRHTGDGKRLRRALVSALNLDSIVG
jgi:hypothetical protein